MDPPDSPRLFDFRAGAVVVTPGPTPAAPPPPDVDDAPLFRRKHRTAPLLFRGDSKDTERKVDTDVMCLDDLLSDVKSADIRLGGRSGAGSSTPLFDADDPLTRACMADAGRASVIDLGEHERAFSARICEAMELIRIKQEGLARFHPTDLRLSTMTVMVELDRPSVDLNVVEAAFHKQEVQDGIDASTFTVTMSPKPMRNAITFRMRCGGRADDTKRAGRRAIHVFSNGIFHVVGCVTAADLIETAQVAADILSASTGKKYGIKTFAVEMINTDFAILVNGEEVGLDLYEAYARMAVRSDVQATYDQENHAAVNIKVPTSTRRLATIMLFHSGRVIVTGVVNAAELRDAYFYIVEFLDQHILKIAKVKVPRVSSAAKRGRGGPAPVEDEDGDDDIFDMDLGGNLSDLMSSLKCVPV